MNILYSKIKRESYNLAQEARAQSSAVQAGLDHQQAAGNAIQNLKFSTVRVYSEATKIVVRKFLFLDVQLHFELVSTVFILTKLNSLSHYPNMI